MTSPLSERVRVITSDLLLSTGLVRMAISTRDGGVSPPPLDMNLSFKVGDEPSNVRENRRRFLQVLGTSEEHLALPSQVHGDRVLGVSAPGMYEEGDGLITNVRGLFIGVSVADCVPILLLDERVRVVAAVHAGWRGTASGVVRKAISMMQHEYDSDPKDVLAFIGPCASTCCYVVGSEVAERFDDAVKLEDGDKTILDLKKANTAALISAGVDEDNIEVSPHCTISEPDLFHSYRRDKESSGRMLAVIGLVAP